MTSRRDESLNTSWFDANDVRRQLEDLGYSDVPDSVVEEFTRDLMQLAASQSITSSRATYSVNSSHQGQRQGDSSERFQNPQQSRRHTSHREDVIPVNSRHHQQRPRSRDLRHFVGASTMVAPHRESDQGFHMYEDQSNMGDVASPTSMQQRERQRPAYSRRDPGYDLHTGTAAKPRAALVETTNDAASVAIRNAKQALRRYRTERESGGHASLSSPESDRAVPSMPYTAQSRAGHGNMPELGFELNEQQPFAQDRPSSQGFARRVLERGGFEQAWEALSEDEDRDDFRPSNAGEPLSRQLRDLGLDDLAMDQDSLYRSQADLHQEDLDDHVDHQGHPIRRRPSWNPGNLGPGEQAWPSFAMPSRRAPPSRALAVSKLDVWRKDAAGRQKPRTDVVRKGEDYRRVWSTLKLPGQDKHLKLRRDVHDWLLATKQ